MKQIQVVQSIVMGVNQAKSLEEAKVVVGEGARMYVRLGKRQDDKPEDAAVVSAADELVKTESSDETPVKKKRAINRVSPFEELKSRHIRLYHTVNGVLTTGSGDNNTTAISLAVFDPHGDGKRLYYLHSDLDRMAVAVVRQKKAWLDSLTPSEKGRIIVCPFTDHAKQARTRVVLSTEGLKKWLSFGPNGPAILGFIDSSIAEHQKQLSATSAAAAAAE